MDKNTGIQQKVALITGASKGIGKAIAQGFAQMGYTTILFGRNLTDLKSVSFDIQDKTGKLSDYYSVDIADSDQVNTAIQDIMDRHGRIDVLVNNAGIHQKGTLDLDEKNFRSLMETNITGQFIVAKAVVPVMKESGSGYLFNVASRSAKIGFAGTGGYCASKWGLLGLSESLYRELTPLGIKVTALCPAWVDTDMADRAGSPLEPEQRIQTNDIFNTIQWLLNLSSGACVKEVVITNPLSL